MFCVLLIVQEEDVQSRFTDCPFIALAAAVFLYLCVFVFHTRSSIQIIPPAGFQTRVH